MTGENDDLWSAPRPPAMPWERGAPHATPEALAAAERLERAITTHGPPACATGDPEQWFPSKGQALEDPIRLCDACPLTTACLEYALIADERYGIWGGTTPNRRIAIRTQADRDGRNA